MANQLACADCAHHSTCIHLHHIDSRKATCIFSPSRFAVNQTRRADKAEARVKELEREKDHANMVADAAAEKIKDLKDESAHAADSEKGGE